MKPETRQKKFELLSEQLLVGNISEVFKLIQSFNRLECILLAIHLMNKQDCSLETLGSIINKRLGK